MTRIEMNKNTCYCAPILRKSHENITYKSHAFSKE